MKVESTSHKKDKPGQATVSSSAGRFNTKKPELSTQGSSKSVVVTESSTVVKDNETEGITEQNPPLSSTENYTKPHTAVDNFIKAVKNISRVQFSYVIIGVCLMLNAFLFLVLYCRSKNRLTGDIDHSILDGFQSVSMGYKGTLICLLGLFFVCYVGLEVSFGALVTTFAVEYMDWSKSQGATVAAIFWGSLATGRGIAIFIANCCGPAVMLIIDLTFMIIGGIVLTMGVQYYDKLLWLGTLVLGLGMSSVFPAGISWAEKYFRVTGKSTAVFVIGSAAGQMIVPSVIGYFYENFSAMVLMYASLALCVTSTVIFITMQCVAVKMNRQVTVKNRDGFLPLEDEEDETVEMDLVHFDKSKTVKSRKNGDVQYHALISDLDDD